MTTRLKTRQGMGCGVWGVGKIEAMQRGLGGFPHERLHQDREFGVTPAITIGPKPD
ncbi:MAG: hypothetical protein F6J90_37690 [Moorea sp. SIOASIH]|uniref:hypothetical protein n=1 Tax=Moorena sp. SIOASIH TaxID=2607817 RepID=UPI0013BA9361|nr:hypothetical protein [Moorena sp. SIOASIH]NEO41752.1 hypothetical protein [Moorena sp. SIOASIH]